MRDIVILLSFRPRTSEGAVTYYVFTYIYISQNGLGGWTG